MASTQSILHGPSPLRLVSVLKYFPPITYAFAYGSGAHHQPGLYENVENKESASTASQPDDRRSAPSTTSRQGPVIDFIFAVKDAHEWHQQNLARNPGHYSWIGSLGANAVCGIAEAIGVGVHFNTLVQLNDEMIIKYGVIETTSLERDLALWERVYIAGRMHKPVTALMTPPPPALAAAQAANLHNAVAAALVLLPPTFTEEELLRTVVGLSYRGDVRLAVGAEDPHKVERIVDGSWDELYGMYMPLLATLSSRHSALGLEPAGQVAAAPGVRGGCNRLWRQTKDTEAQAAALGLLAPGLLHEMAARLGYHVPVDHLAPGTTTQGEVVAVAMQSGAPQRLVADSLAAIIRRSSIYQAAAGLLAAGGGKAVQYVGAKVAKAVRPLLAVATSAGGSFRSGRAGTDGGKAVTPHELKKTSSR